MSDPFDLIESSRKGDLASVTSFVTNSSDAIHINDTDEEKRTALMAASAEGRLEVVKMLLKAGANVYLKDKSGLGPMEYASKKGHTDVVKCLLEHMDYFKYDSSTKVCYQFHLPDSYQNPTATAPLPTASSASNSSSSSSSDSSTSALSGEALVTKQAFERACKEGDIETVRKRISQGGDVSYGWSVPTNALSQAVHNSDKKLLDVLLMSSINHFRISAGYARDALRYALTIDNYDMAKYLFTYEVTNLLRSSDKFSLNIMLNWATDKNDIELIRRIHEIHRSKLDYFDACLVQAKRGNFELIDLVYPFGLFFRKEDNIALKKAINEGDTELVNGIMTIYPHWKKDETFMFDQGGQDSAIRRMLLAASHTRSITLQWLQSNRPGCVNELINSEHFKASMADVAWAYLRGHYHLSQVLYRKVLEHKSLDEIKRSKKDLGVAKLVSTLSAGCTCDMLLDNKYGKVIPKTVILQIIEHQSRGVLQFPDKERQVGFYSAVIENQKRKKECLYIASRFGHYEVVKLLLRHNAKPTFVSAEYDSPLVAAASCGYAEVVKALIKAGTSICCEEKLLKEALNDAKQALSDATKASDSKKVEVQIDLIEKALTRVDKCRVFVEKISKEDLLPSASSYSAYAAKSNPILQSSATRALSSGSENSQNATKSLSEREGHSASSSECTKQPK